MIFLEINEFDPELMRQAATKLQAKSLLKLLALPSAKTKTDDDAERYGLDPWVQWVSIHTGQPSAVHGIKHLGDVQSLKHPQVWEILDDAGISYGVWGAMNAHKGAGKHCKFFFPDPWTFTEDAFPEELNELLALPRYYSKNYLEIDKFVLLQSMLKLARFVLRPTIFVQLLKLVPFLTTRLPLNPVKNYFLFVLFDLINTQLFCTYYQRYKPDFSLLFLNSLAHLQHHCWTGQSGALSKEMQVSFLIFDKIVELVFATLENDESLLVANAFSQYQSYNANEYLYRQNNPQTFFQQFGIQPVKVEQLMTNDSHLFFNSAELAIAAVQALNTASAAGQSAFEAEIDADNPCKVFCQFIIWNEIGAHEKIIINQIERPFYENFQKVVRRSGSHNAEGHLFSNREIAQSELYNHKIFDFILNHYQLSPLTSGLP